MQIKTNSVFRPKEGLTKFFTWEYDIPAQEVAIQTDLQSQKQEIVVDDMNNLEPKESEMFLNSSYVVTPSLSFDDNPNIQNDFETNDYVVLLENAINEHDVSISCEAIYDNSIELADIDEIVSVQKQETPMTEGDFSSNVHVEIEMHESSLETSDIIEVDSNIENDFGEYPSESSPKRKKRYLTNKDFGRLSMIFGDRRIQYFFYSALFFISSTIAATLIYKFSELDISFPLSMVYKYLSFGQSLQKSFTGGLLFSAPLLLSSLFVYLAGYTIYAKLISSFWMLTFGFFWSIFAINSFSTFDVTGKVLFSVLSSILINVCIILAAESGKYSQLTTYGKAELIKLSNVKHFTFIYISFSAITWFINFLFIKLVF